MVRLLTAANRKASAGELVLICQTKRTGAWRVMASPFSEVPQPKTNPNNSMCANGCESGAGNCTFAGQCNRMRSGGRLCQGREMRVGELRRCAWIAVVEHRHEANLLE